MMTPSFHPSILPFFRNLLAFAFLASFAVSSPVLAVPQLISHQGRVTVGGVNFAGPTGAFKFALVNAAGTTTYWSNDGTSAAGSEPTNAVTLPVTDGLYAALLGDTSLANMTALPASVFQNDAVYLRIWFNDGTNGSQLLSPDQRIAAVGYSMISETLSDAAVTTVKLANGAVTATKLATGAVTSDEIADGSITAADLATAASADNIDAAEGLIASGDPSAAALLAAGYLNSGSFDAEQIWNPATVTGAPVARYLHSAVWTGSELIVWGGLASGNIHQNTGGRYNPATDSWTTTTTTGAPGSRRRQTAVWTGTEMIVWGGILVSSALNTGGRYNPVTDSWPASTTTTGAPAARLNHTAVWTGTEMIVWGGNTGTGGGGGFSSGGRYNPAINTWTATTTTGVSGAYSHSAVWADTASPPVMFVWGGDPAGGGDNDTDEGARYNPATDSWATTTTTGAPLGRLEHTAVWTGSRMIVWGGRSPVGGQPNGMNTGGVYDPATDSWLPGGTATVDAPTARLGHTAVWTGDKMVVWGGENLGGGGIRYNSGGIYDPAGNSWTETSLNGAPVAREAFTAVWTGHLMIVWGGSTNGASTGVLNTGARLGLGGTIYVYTKP